MAITDHGIVSPGPNAPTRGGPRRPRQIPREKRVSSGGPDPDPGHGLCVPLAGIERSSFAEDLVTECVRADRAGLNGGGGVALGEQVAVVRWIKAAER